jgi:putative ABC transport system permease protein
MLRVALRNVQAHMVRLGMSILAVVLGVSFIAGTFSLRQMLSDTFDGIVDTGYSADVYLRGTESLTGEASTAVDIGGSVGRSTIPADLTDTIEQVDGVDRASADFSGELVLVGADGTVPASMGSPTMGMSWSPEDTGAPIVEGTAPSGPGEFMLDATAVKTTGLAVGDTTTLVLNGELTEATMTGIVDMEASMAGAIIVMFDVETAAELFAADGNVAAIAVEAAGGVDEDELVERVQAALTAAGEDTGVEVITGTQIREETRDSIQSMLGIIETFLLVFAGISLFVGGFIIANTFSMTVRQRQREFALLRAVGASPLQVFSSILIQAAIVGALGGALGVAGGLGLVTAIKALFGSMNMDLAGNIPVTTSMVVISLAVGIVVSLVSAAIPARRAAIVPPIEAMRDDSPAQATSLMRRALIGLVITGAGAGAVISAVVQASSDKNAGTGSLMGIGAIGVVVGALMLAPVIAKAVLGVMAAPFVALIKPLGKLARGNVTRNPRRTASTASALMIGMALVGAASVLAASMQATVRDVVESESLADLVVSPASWFVPSGAVTDIAALGEVASVDKITYDSYLVDDGSDSGPQALDAMGADPEILGTTWDMDPVEGDLGTLADGEVSVLESSALAEGWTVGDTLTLSSETATTTVRIGSIYNSVALGTPLLVPDTIFDELSSDPADKAVFLLVMAADGTSQDQLHDAVTAAAKPYQVLSVMDNEEFISQLGSQIDTMLVILYALLGLSIVIAILGIINTLALSVIERTREIGLMRAVGLGRAQLAGTIVIESVLTAVFGTLLGLGVGIALAAGMPTVFASSGLTDLVIPWASLAIMLGISVVVGVLAALWPAIRASRLPVLEAVTVD